MRLAPNAATRVSLAALLEDSTNAIRAGAVTITATSLFGPSRIVGVLDIENQTGLVTVGAPPAAAEFVFPHVANGDGLFTGLAFATGSTAASITIEVYDRSGGTPKSVTITLDANQHLGRLVSELVPIAATQTDGYIRVRSDQPIWAWEIYGSGQMLASVPPL